MHSLQAITARHGRWATGLVACAGVFFLLGLLPATRPLGGVMSLLVAVAALATVMVRRRRGPAIALAIALVGLVVAGTLDAASSPTQPSAPAQSASPARELVPTAAPLAAAASAAATPAPASAAGSTRGLFDTVVFWDQHHPTVAINQCIEAGEAKPVGVGELHAWQVNSDAIACYDDQFPGAGVWGGRITGFDLFFPKRVPEEQAAAIAAAILPADAHQTGFKAGVNEEGSATPSGTCHQIDYSSPALGAAVHAAKPDWSDDPANVSVTLFSGHDDPENSNGADRPYTADSVGQALISIGSSRAGPDGFIHC